MNQPIGHLEPKTYNLRNREQAKRKPDSIYTYDLDKAVDQNDQLVQPENIDTEQEMLKDSGRSWLGDNPNQIVFENEIPEEILSAWAHKQPMNPAEPPRPLIVSEDGSSVLPLKQWIEKQHGLGIKPNTEQDLVPAYLSDETSIAQSVTELAPPRDPKTEVVRVRTHGHCAVCHKAEPELIRIIPRPVDALQRPSEVIEENGLNARPPMCVESTSALHTGSESRIGELDTTAASCTAPAWDHPLAANVDTLPPVSQELAPTNPHEDSNVPRGVDTDSTCNPPTYPDNFNKDFKIASAELRGRNRSEIFNVIRLRNNREIIIPAPTQERRGEGGDVNKVELAPTKLKFDQLPGQIKKAVPVIHGKK